MSSAKLTKLQAQARVLAVEAAQHKRWVSKQTLASFAGYVVSLSIAMPLARFHLLPIYDSLNTNSGWGYGVQVRLTTGAYRELKFILAVSPPATWAAVLNLSIRRHCLRTPLTWLGGGI